MLSAAESPLPASRRNMRVVAMRLKTSAIPDSSGHIDESNPANWEPATNVGTAGRLWIGLAPRGSREFFRQEQVSADITHAANAAYQDAKNVTKKMRFLFKGRTLNISEPPRNVDENNHSLVFACVEVKEGS